MEQISGAHMYYLNFEGWAYVTGTPISPSLMLIFIVSSYEKALHGKKTTGSIFLF